MKNNKSFNIIKEKEIDYLRIYSFKDIVLLDCSRCGKEYEWVHPMTVCSYDYKDEYDVSETCRIHRPVQQNICTNCQAKKRIAQANRKNKKGKK